MTIRLTLSEIDGNEPVSVRSDLLTVEVASSLMDPVMVLPDPVLEMEEVYSSEKLEVMVLSLTEEEKVMERSSERDVVMVVVLTKASTGMMLCAARVIINKMEIRRVLLVGAE